MTFTDLRLETDIKPPVDVQEWINQTREKMWVAYWRRTMDATVGRTVHYYDHTGYGPLAAIINKVHSAAMVNLTIFGDGGRYPSAVSNETSVAFEENAVNQKRWCWPPRV